MKRYVLTLALAVMAFPVSLRAQGVLPPPPPEISTSAEGEIRLPPTRALVRLAIETRANNAAAASSQAGQKVKAVREAIRGLGYPLDSIRTVGFTVTPTYDYQRGQKPVDYRGFATIELNVRNLEKVAAVMDTALATGVTQVPDVSFDSDSVQSARGQAIAKAMAAAKADAEATARAAGGRLGKLLSASTSGGGYPRPMMEMRAQAQFKEAGGAPDVNRDVVINVTVQARWEFVGQQ